MKQNECPICRHVERKSIDHAIAQGQPDSYLASHFATDAEWVEWHKENCLKAGGRRNSSSSSGGGSDPDELRRAQQAVLREMRAAATRIATDAAGKEPQWRTALAAINSVSKLLVQEARLAEKKGLPRPRLADSAEWSQLKARILKALDPFPEAGRALREALEHHDA